jgi:hypothetical protein
MTLLGAIASHNARLKHATANSLTQRFRSCLLISFSFSLSFITDYLGLQLKFMIWLSVGQIVRLSCTGHNEFAIRAGPSEIVGVDSANQIDPAGTYLDKMAAEKVNHTTVIATDYPARHEAPSMICGHLTPALRAHFSFNHSS